MGVIDDDLDFDNEVSEVETDIQADVQADEDTELVTEPTEGDEATKQEGPDVEALNKAQAAAEAKEKREAALTAFAELVENHATDEGEQGRDVSTGELSEAQTAAITVAYQGLDLPGKNAAKKAVQDELTSIMMKAPTDPSGADLMWKARSYSIVLNALQNAAATKAKRETVNREPVDPTPLFVQRATSLYLAVSLIKPPAGVADNWSDKMIALAEAVKGDVETYRAWLNSTDAEKGDAPEVNEVVIMAAKVAAGRAVAKPRAAGTKPAGTSTPRDPNSPTRNISKHIAEAFRGQAVGTEMTTSAISAFQSVEYGDTRPSPGAITAKMWKKDASGIQVKDNRIGAWIEGVDADESGPKRFRLVADVPGDTEV